MHIAFQVQTKDVT